MSASIDALAMAGADYEKLSIDPDDDDDRIPRYLLAENFEASMSDNEGRDGAYFHCRVINGDEEATRKNSMAWAKQVEEELMGLRALLYRDAMLYRDTSAANRSRMLLNAGAEEGAPIDPSALRDEDRMKRESMAAWAKAVASSLNNGRRVHDFRER